MKKLNKNITTLLIVLVFGSLWGILEATLGSLLHLSDKVVGFWASSTTIMVPISYALMGIAASKSKNYRTIIYMGLLAASMKAISCALFNLNFNPCLYILLESGFMAVAYKVTSPQKIISFRFLLTMAIANTLYLFTSIGFIKTVQYDFTSLERIAIIKEHVFLYNGLGLAYSTLIGSAIYGLNKLMKVEKWNINLNKIIYSPITASLLVVLGFALTILCK